MKPLIIALDVETDKEALNLIKATRDSCDLYKIGPTHVLRYGPSIFKKIRKTGKKIFLDLKFHDIPNTMLRSIKEAGKNNIYSTTVHTSAGGTALRTIAGISSRPHIWGVTVLTSLDSRDLKSLGIKFSPKEQVLHLADLAKHAGLDGVVASVSETSSLRHQLGPKFQIVTPGIRMMGDTTGDQKRIATPQHAKRAGSTFMVVGRPIIEARDPGQVAEDLLNEWKKES